MRKRNNKHKVFDMSTGLYMVETDQLEWSDTGSIFVNDENDTQFSRISRHFAKVVNKKKGECVSPLWSVIEVDDEGKSIDDFGFSAQLIEDAGNVTKDAAK